MSTFELKAEVRKDEGQGKGASRRLRRLEGKAPAIIYGAGKDPVAVSIIHKDLLKMQQDEAFFTSLLTLDVEGTTETVVVKALQRHPAKDIIMHADFLRTDANTKITVNVPLHFINEDKCFGVRMQGGSITHSAKNVEIRCLPANLPTFIEVDMEKLEAGTTVHISDLQLPEGVESTALALGSDHDLSLAQVVAPKGGK